MEYEAEIKELVRDVFVKELKPYIDDIKTNILRFEDNENLRHKELWLELRLIDKKVIWAEALTLIVTTLLTGAIALVYLFKH